MYPTMEDVKEIAASGEYRRIPVCRELYSDRYTPVEVMRTLRKASRHCYLLESASQTEVWGRYSFLGYDPTMEITCTDGVVRIRKTGNEGPDEVEEQKVSHPGNVLRRIISDYKSPVMESMPPFTGGLVGYFSYDYIKYSEPKLKLEDEEMQDFRDMDMMLFDRVIAFDHYRQKVLLIAGVMADRVEESYRQAEEALEEMAALIRCGNLHRSNPVLCRKNSDSGCMPWASVDLRSIRRRSFLCKGIDAWKAENDSSGRRKPPACRNGTDIPGGTVSFAGSRKRESSERIENNGRIGGW